jgi:hypothetical protein
MCDYSLMGVPNRLATEGEELVTYKFSTGSIGLAPRAEVQKVIDVQAVKGRKFWSYFHEIFSAPARNCITAVCIPPGARLLMKDVPEVLQRRLSVGSTEEVTFTQISAASNAYRDAIRFRDGRELLLQELPAGQRFRVLDLSSAEPREPEIAERSPYLVVS